MALDVSGSVFPVLSADEAAAMIPHGATVGLGGFTTVGTPHAVCAALARRADALHRAGQPFKIRLLTGASTGPDVDEILARNDAVGFRAPYQSSRSMRERINQERIEYVDVHLSHVSPMLLSGVFGHIDVAIVEATEITQDGRVYLSASIGNAPTFLHLADRVIIERNHRHSTRLREMADILLLPMPPHRVPVGIRSVLQKAGEPFARVDPAKVIGIVDTDTLVAEAGFTGPDAVSRRIAEHVVRFFADEVHAGRMPPGLLPIQCGVGNVANAVLQSLGEHPDIPPFSMFSEVFQDACVGLMLAGRLTSASAAALALTAGALGQVYEAMDFFAPRIVLRPQELSNHPALARRLGIIAMNTALEVDIYGHVNSTHVAGTQLMNGIGGSGDFERNAFLSMFVCPSVAKGGRISAVVPMCSHVDHSEHSVQIVVTEQGLADLRGLAPLARARRLIDRCAHPAYRGYLLDYLEHAPHGHIRHDLTRCFELHRNLLEHGAMLPGVDFAQFDDT